MESPRYMLKINDNQAYVTDLYSDSIALINLNTLSVEYQIYTGSWTEELVFLGDKVLVTQPLESTVLIIDPSTH